MFDLLKKQNQPIIRGKAQSTLPVTALYERLSRDDDNEGESNSIANQRKLLESYARENGFTNCRHYTDDGYSGGTFDRPGWKQMLADIEGNLVKTVLVKDMSRVGRNYVETGFYTEIYFGKMGVRFIAICNNIDNVNPDSTEFAGILNIMNEWYLRDASRKVRAALQQKGKSGKPLASRPCFGYMKDPDDKNHWIIDPEAAKTVRRVFELAASGMSQLQICRTLVQERYVTPGYYRLQHSPDGAEKQFENCQPYHWHHRMITKLVRRREYLGHTVNFKTSFSESRGKQIYIPLEDQLVFMGTHEAIVDEDTWQKAQRIFRPGTAKKAGPPCVLNKLLVCGECGVPMRFQRRYQTTLSGRKENNAFYCYTHRKSAAYETRLCSYNSIRVSAVRQLIHNTLRMINRYAIEDEAAFRRQVEKIAKDAHPYDQKQLTKQIQTCEKRLAQLEHLLKKLYENYALELVPEERFILLSTQYEQEEVDLKIQVANAHARLAEIQAAAPQTDRYLALVQKYKDCTELTDEMILAFVKKIVVYKTIIAEDGQRTRRIDVYLNYIGQFAFPPEEMPNKPNEYPITQQAMSM